MKGALKSLRTLVGRVWRDIDRKLDREDEIQAAKAAGILERVKRLLEQKPKAVFVDKGYRGVSVEGVTIWRSGQKRGVTQSIGKAIRRRSAIEPAIGHMKNEGKLRRKWLKGSIDDALNAVLCGAGHNLRMILRAIRFFCAWMLCFSTAETNRR
jgi:IS5 family transposase